MRHDAELLQLCRAQSGDSAADGATTAQGEDDTLDSLVLGKREFAHHGAAGSGARDSIVARGQVPKRKLAGLVGACAVAVGTLDAKHACRSRDRRHAVCTGESSGDQAATRQANLERCSIVVDREIELTVRVVACANLERDASGGNTVQHELTVHSRSGTRAQAPVAFVRMLTGLMEGDVCGRDAGARCFVVDATS